ncbi:hypothetical protein [Actinomadura hibisca]|uniref:hypothetical protein n=1 Tax=Actinomadura hibisca TaxID=68565 RepID=UPI0008335272|nr:hypothetical protein [Actinomadura hibisca]
MRTRSLALVVPALILAASACAQEPAAAPKPSPTTAAPSTPVPAPSTPSAAPTPAKPRAKKTTVKATPPRKPVLSGPHTNCGEIQPPPSNGPMAVVAVWKGRANCAQAIQVFQTYYRKSTPKQGSAGIATVNGWLCASNSAAEASTTGRLTSCRKGTATIVADIIP